MCESELRTVTVDVSLAMPNLNASRLSHRAPLRRYLNERGSAPLPADLTTVMTPLLRCNLLPSKAFSRRIPVKGASHAAASPPRCHSF